jgi:hypothetical protein
MGAGTAALQSGPPPLPSPSPHHSGTFHLAYILSVGEKRKLRFYHFRIEGFKGTIEPVAVYASIHIVKLQAVILSLNSNIFRLIEGKQLAFLKGAVSRDFRPLIFLLHQTSSLQMCEPLICTLNKMFILRTFGEELQLKINTSGSLTPMSEFYFQTIPINMSSLGLRGPSSDGARCFFTEKRNN